jgi:alkanesulfonate monooxygenase SsuD/methylene tetrahydromethanopterin reductase-like flavin-dependent oxidoreductase (luciferase family)
VSVGAPMHFDDVKASLYPDTADVEDFSFERVTRLLRYVAGEAVASFSGTEGIEEFSDRVEPHSPGLRSRLWYGGATTASVRWAGQHRMNLLTSSIVAQDPDRPSDFAETQARQIQAFRATHPEPESARVSQGLVVIPTDSATPAQRQKYADFVSARLPRTRNPVGPKRYLISPDLVGSSAQIAEQLYAHAAFREVDEVAFALPFTFAPQDYVQILTDMASTLGPALGWRPAEQVDLRTPVAANLATGTASGIASGTGTG